MATIVGNKVKLDNGKLVAAKTGDWQDGQHVWQDPSGNWTLSAKGVESQYSPSATAGKKVSAEVNLQADKAQGLTPGTIQKYLDGYQANVNSGLPSDSPALRSDFGTSTPAVISPLNFTDIKSSLTPTTTMPAPLDRVASFEKYRDQYQVADLETQLNDFKAQQKEIDAQLRTNKIAERGKPVATNVIEGRISKESQQAQEQYDFVGRQISSITDQLSTANNAISLFMNFENLDYQDATARYNTEFTQNLQVIDLVRNIQKDQITEEQRKIDNARANLTVFSNAITSGNMNPANLSSDQKLQIQKLEVQSGLPVGFTQSLGLSAKDRIISTSTDNGVTQIVMSDASGNLTVKKVGTPTSSTTVKTPVAISAMQTKLIELKGAGSFISPKDWNQQRLIWQQGQYDVKDFDNAFKSQFVNWEKATDYGFNVEKSALNL